MRVNHSTVVALAFCGAITASATHAQNTSPMTPASPQATSRQKPATPAAPPPIVTPPPDSALPPSTTSTGLPPGNRTVEQQQQDLHDEVQHNSTDSIRRDSLNPDPNANSLGQPASGSSTR